MWKLCDTLLNNQESKNKSKVKQKKNLEKNKNRNTTCQNLYDAVKAV